MTRIRDLIAVSGIVLTFMVVADWRYRHPGPSIWFQYDNNDHLGAEYDEIARAIRSGRGFSDPFRVASGPTAWMAPVLPYVLAGLYWVGGDNRELVVDLVLLGKCWILILTGFLVVGVGRRMGRQWIAYLIVIGGLITHFHDMFQKTHDVWLLLLVVDVMWLGIVRIWDAPKSTLVSGVWGIFGGLSALTSPVAGAAWAMLTAARWRPRREGDRRACGAGLSPYKPLVIAALCSMLVVAPWMARNRMVLGRWIPIKSNVVYEIWQSLCLDDDGVVDNKTFASHPWTSSGAQRIEYVRMGEVQFVSSRWPLVLNAIREDPVRVLEGFTNRFLAAVVVYQPSAWEAQQAPWVLGLKYVGFALPCVSLLVVLWRRKSPLEKEFLAAAWICAAYLLPYVLVSYYARYAMPLLGLKMLIVLYGCDSMLTTSSPSTRSTGLRACG